MHFVGNLGNQDTSRMDFQPYSICKVHFCLQLL